MNDFDSLLACAKTTDADFAVQNAKENTNEYLRRIMLALNEASDDAFEELPKSAQNWYEANIKLVPNKSATLTIPEGFTEAAPKTAKAPKAAAPAKASKGKPAPAAPAPEPVVDAKAKAKMTPSERMTAMNAAKAAKKALGVVAGAPKGATKPAKAEKAPKAAKEPKAPKVKAPRVPKVDGITSVLRRYVIENEEVTVAELMELAAKNGKADLKLSTVSTVRTDTKLTLRVLRAMGKLK